MVNYYFVNTQKKLEIALCDMFNNLYVNKFSDLKQNSIDRSVKVPLVIYYDKNFSNFISSTSTQKKMLPVPIIGLRYTGETENSAGRTQPNYLRNVFSKANNEFLRDIQPTPRFFNFELSVLTHEISDWQQLKEQIIPYFNTYRTLRIKEFDFAPDLERKVVVYLSNTNENLNDTMEIGSKQREYITTYSIRLEADYYRPIEIPKIIKYTNMNISVDEFVHQIQNFVYPEPIAIKEKKDWELIGDTTQEGLKLLKSSAGTLVKQVDIDGNTYFKDITIPEAKRTVKVPVFDMLNLQFNSNSPTQLDISGFNRDFTMLSPLTATVENKLGQVGLSGTSFYENTDWNNIMEWFNDENGNTTSPFTFEISMQFKGDYVGDTIFQSLKNEATTYNNMELQAGDVYFEWGYVSERLFFTYKTHGENGRSKTFITSKTLRLNLGDIYKFVFVLYNYGDHGIFAMSKNLESTYVLETEESDTW